ncbi:hypothetical protein [Gemmatimonas phototrophica]|uniref:Uncharacterized protein n=1 Tax=Gemmatimonas phototrophica TaxID=1379270 RepID=A0A143BMD6_9BACT|nr:hypothetical protein [Gemmatimonas phototrophica]AMW06217.1 hypothetical protein GEMMAAP_18370 [Gemmatimonas phototrophica]
MTGSARIPSGVERRANPRLRELVDEMLASIRIAANAELWTPDERARYEAEMARIMDSVRQQAIGGPAARARLE